MVDNNREQVETIGEWLGKVKFHGIKPQYVDPDHPEETIAFFTVQGREGDMLIPTGPAGEDGKPGEPAEPFIWQPEIASKSNLPQYLGEVDKGLAWVISSTKELVYWDGFQYVTLSSVLISGPQGKQGTPGNRGQQGIPGPQGKVGPAASINDAQDYDKSGAAGDVLVKTSTGWTAKSFKSPQRYIVPSGNIKTLNESVISTKTEVDLCTITIPPQPFDFTIGCNGIITVGQGASVVIDVDVMANNIKVGQGFGVNPAGVLDNLGLLKGGHSQMNPISVTTSAPNIMTPNSPGAALFKANTNVTVVCKAKKNSTLVNSIGSWSTDGNRSNLEITVYPVTGV